MQKRLFWLIPLAVVLLVGGYVWSSYNRLVTLDQEVENKWAQVETQYQRRFDLIPNLVETAKGYLQHERQTLEAVTNARNQASSAVQKAASDPSNASAIQGLIGAESVLSGALGRLFAVVEAYPDLKANQTMLTLMEELTSTENKIAFARQAYNDTVMVYNTARETFPDLLIARPLGFNEAQLFEVAKPEEREAQKVSFQQK